MRIIIIVIRILAGLLVLATGCSLIESNEWWMRIWDFPRLQLLCALLMVMAVLVWIDRAGRRWLAPLCAVAAGWQMVRVFPYTPLAKTEMALVGDGHPGQCFTAMAFNVLESNRDYGRTLRLIERVDPDILVLMETDDRWAAALDGVLKGYPHVLSETHGNTYGMIFATRLAMRRGRIESIADEDTPSVDAVLEGGVPFRVIALHPQPPVPGKDTEARDAEIAVAARRAARERLPVLALGDFNDVAWSHTSQLFKRIGGYLDPRVGRGVFPTFPAQVPWLGWPLDHLFVTPEFAVRSISVLENVGSDHLPISAEVCLGGPRPANDAPDPVTAEDREDVDEVMDEYREAKADGEI
ncbi:endonuclease/exonuclease/phosphatase family protein [Polymorphobacter sp.]|uniref:endonuclease/exonuclease/phosphatase family protein n=1 Tax=Polymorphobacter sp. TaxID=1909290 RepID=UPI003F718EFF